MDTAQVHFHPALSHLWQNAKDSHVGIGTEQSSSANAEPRQLIEEPLACIAILLCCLAVQVPDNHDRARPC